MCKQKTILPYWASKEYLDPVDNPEDILIHHETVNEVNRLIDELGSDLRKQYLNLYLSKNCYHDQTYKEMADIMGVTAQAVSVQVKNILTLVAAKLQTIKTFRVICRDLNRDSVLSRKYFIIHAEDIVKAKSNAIKLLPDTYHIIKVIPEITIPSPVGRNIPTKLNTLI